MPVLLAGHVPLKQAPSGRFYEVTKDAGGMRALASLLERTITTRTYPYKAWALHPSLKPIEIELVAHYRSFGRVDYGDLTAKGKRYGVNQIYPTKAAAIAVGRADIARAEADLAKRTTNLNKKRAALNKAEHE